jgi:uncharacterized membrane protein/heat shock protein HslJ
MKTLTYFILSIGSIFLYSCGSSSGTTSYTDPHTEAHKQMHTDFIQEELKKELIKIVEDFSGIYAGEIPCSDCEKIIYQLQLNEDLTYYSKVIYQGKSDIPVEKSGIYSFKNKLTIQLEEKEGSMNYFKKSGKRLLMLDKNGKEITGDQSEKYYLLPVQGHKIEPTENNKQQFMLEKWKEGIDFYALGNEPFWSLEMDLNRAFKFKNMNDIEFVSPSTKPISTINADIIRYLSASNSGEINITLNHTECVDNMSGERFQYKVTIDYKNSSKTEYKTFKGCGNYVPDPRLQDLWIVKEVDGILIDSEDFNGEIPRLELNPFENKISGNDGCNTFNGEIEVLNDTIIFGDLLGTLMACPNMDITSKITETISGKKLNYNIKNDKLYFLKNDIEVMVLHHANQ